MDYKKTLNLPSTKFAMKANLPQREPEQLKQWDDNKIYDKLREQAEDRPLFILHDGPPYANGHLHMGHAINKILKDIIVRSRRWPGSMHRMCRGGTVTAFPLSTMWTSSWDQRKRDDPVQVGRRARNMRPNCGYSKRGVQAVRCGRAVGKSLPDNEFSV